ncbi:hypothetical protein [uncultured Fibrella sp.]|uniref:hypothetical protein n=1 Tax=uncultured Fibrella sp. TaxID=1284596 RepID=UPI0035CB115C
MLPLDVDPLFSHSSAFRIVVISLVDPDTYDAYEHLLEIIAEEDYLPFIELLKEGVPLRACFSELEAFLAWRRKVQPFITRYKNTFISPDQEVQMYLIEKRFQLPISRQLL